MIVTPGSFEYVLKELGAQSVLTIDSETTGLRPYHGDKIFSLILGFKDSMGIQAFYFNFATTPPAAGEDEALGPEQVKWLGALFSDPTKTWYIHNALFDMHMLNTWGIEIAGEIICTMVHGRLEYNEHMDYDLDSSLARIGLKKDGAVEKWIEENHAFEKIQVPGKKQTIKNKFYEKVPYEIIVPYGIGDAAGCFALGNHLEASISRQASEYPVGVPNLLSASKIERRLTKTVFRMERRGIKIDRAYVQRALKYEDDRLQKSTVNFKRETGRDFAASPKLFSEIFTSDKDRWAFTEKGNASFDSDTLKTFHNPVAKEILAIRDAKSKLDFYNGFLWHADADDVIHPHFKSTGTRTFRFSSSEPNLQNLTSEEATYCRACKNWLEEMTSTCTLCDSADVEHPEFLVRRAFVPRPGFVFLMPDWSSVEYSVMLDIAKHMMIQEFRARGQSWDESYFEVANKVAQGFDVHKATAELMGVSRKFAKTLNFLLLYGGGSQKLADSLGITLSEAETLKAKYFKALPYVQFMISTVIRTIKTRGWIRSWAGYKYTFPDRNFAFTGPNTLIQGGCAAIAKIAMNEIDEYLLDKKSKLVLSIHDELPCECSIDELAHVPRTIEEIMKFAYPHKYIPLRVSMEWSDKSLADKKKGLPV